MADAAQSKLIGRPVHRIDGRAKVTGAAHYGADHLLPGSAHAFLVTSAIARGRIRNMDTASVRAMPGVLLVLTHENMGNVLAPVGSIGSQGPMAFPKAPLGSDEIFFADQIVALVVADSFERARAAALAMHVDYEPQTATASMDDRGSQIVPAKGQGKSQLSHGDADAAWRRAAVKIHQRYETPAQHHNPMELFQSTCAWDGDRLTVWESSQHSRAYQHGLAKQLGIDADKVRVITPFIGGAFGSRGPLAHYTALVAHASRTLGRPVRLVCTRQQGFSVRTFRAESRHDIHLAASRDGRLEALSHESWELTTRSEAFALAGSDATARLYACANVSTLVHNVLADRQLPGHMRAPPELPYLFAMESAMDELAHELGMDPIELRRRNDTKVDPVDGYPYTSRELMPCFDKAAAAIGWGRRRAKPGSTRQGDWLIGLGCASAFYPANIGPADCRVTLLARDRAKVEIGTHEIGNGAYTIIAQVAAEVLGIPLENVQVQVGDSALPATPITAGSNAASTTCNAVAATCERLRKTVQSGAAYPITLDWTNQPEGSGIEKVREGSHAMAGGVGKHDLRFACGAQFAEVRVHAATGEIRIPRLAAAFACGRIINPVTARSQLMAGQIWGASSALFEATHVDARTARYVNKDLAEYHVPVNADIGEVITLMLADPDTQVNPLGMKGVGEIGATGVNAAVANAVFNATGVRVRKLPIRLDDLLGNALAV
jgi:xanthine dehydrogenase YagR molybdenum-binding subunit